MSSKNHLYKLVNKNHYLRHKWDYHNVLLLKGKCILNRDPISFASVPIESYVLRNTIICLKRVTIPFKNTFSDLSVRRNRNISVL